MNMLKLTRYYSDVSSWRYYQGMVIQSTFNSFSTRINSFHSLKMASWGRRNLGTLVSLRNKTVGRRGRKNTDFHLTLIFSVFFFTKKICLKESEVWRKDIQQNYCHACHTRFPSPVLLRTFIWFIEFTQQHGRKKRTANRLCVTNVEGLLLVCFVVIFTNINGFWSFTKKICLKEREVWRKLISNIIIVTLVTQGLRSSFYSRPVA